jgi:hypothetical protein
MDQVFASLADLKRELDLLPDQQIGNSGAVSDVGEPYIEFYAHGIARPGDEKIVERHVANTMARQLRAYFGTKNGRIYWRHPLEFKVESHQEILRVDANGDDIDFVTGQKCVMDKNWLVVRAYCRLVKAKMKIAA